MYDAVLPHCFCKLSAVVLYVVAVVPWCHGVLALGQAQEGENIYKTYAVARLGAFLSI